MEKNIRIPGRAIKYRCKLLGGLYTTPYKMWLMTDG